ncbi:DUF262 domain-containing protein [Hungatella effluvii]|uniref:DUF262 domain-containing protein n=1 Tax=Hungatella effluvii TaxID=1096246 RepID=UPI0022E4D879|nr:DUF262 domain-containing protein [Hungatella effluvii]
MGKGQVSENKKKLITLAEDFGLSDREDVKRIIAEYSSYEQSHKALMKVYEAVYLGKQCNQNQTNKFKGEYKRMIKKANINWTARQLAKMVGNKKITFDNAVQRGYVWDTTRKSLLIHSMIVGYPIPAFYAAKNDDGYDMLDGQQRSRTITDFLEGKFALTGVPEVEAENEDGTTEIIDITGLKFDQLRQSIQDEITGYSLTVYYFDGITDDEISELFFRLNNGKPLSAIELTRVKSKSMETIKELGQHALFKSALTEKAMIRYTNEDIVIKSYAVLHEPEPCLETKVIRPLMERVNFSEKDRQQLNEIYTRILSVYQLVEDKKKTGKRLLTRTHLISVIPMIWKSINDGLSDKQIAEWISKFFAGTRSASISAIYNENAGSGSARKEAVRKRLDEVEKSYKEFFKTVLAEPAKIA